MMTFYDVKALTFDVFGTVTDWRSTVIREGRQLGAAKGIDIDWVSFADEWRAGYQPAMGRVRSGELGWTTIDVLHRIILDDLLEKYGITQLSESEIADLNRVWHRLDAWDDAREGLELLRKRFVIATLSNGNVALLTNTMRHADLRFDCILSAELARHYKPDPEAYLTAARLLGLESDQVMMVAAHNGDLKAAQSVGFRTAMVIRPIEHGESQSTDLEPNGNYDFVARDFIDLAGQLDIA